MNCQNIHDLLDAWVDNELDGAERIAVESHLGQCEQCRQLGEKRKRQDDELREMLSDRSRMAARVAEQVSSLIETEASTPPHSGGGGNTRGFMLAPVWQLAIALAAGFLIAVTVMQPWGAPPETRMVENLQPPSVGKVTVASGPIEFRPDRKVDWFVCPTDSSLPAGTELRTLENIGCQISSDDGTSIHLGKQTDVQLKSKNEVNLSKGRLFVCSPDEKPVSVFCNGLKASVENGKVDMKQTDEATEIIAIDSPVKVWGKGWSETIPAGHVARISAGGVDDKSESGNILLATRWIHDIIALKSSDPVAVERVSELLASIGSSKMDHLYEGEIRALGQAAAGPLIAYLNSKNPEHQDQWKRRQAAQILADICTRGNVQQLLVLLNDDDVEVARSIESGLSRVTGLKPIPVQKAGRPSQDHWMDRLKPASEASPWRVPPKKNKA